MMVLFDPEVLLECAMRMHSMKTVGEEPDRLAAQEARS